MPKPLPSFVPFFLKKNNVSKCIRNTFFLIPMEVNGLLTQQVSVLPTHLSCVLFSMFAQIATLSVSEYSAVILETRMRACLKMWDICAITTVGMLCGMKISHRKPSQESEQTLKRKAPALDSASLLFTTVQVDQPAVRALYGAQPRCLGHYVYN